MHVIMARHDCVLEPERVIYLTSIEVRELCDTIMDVCPLLPDEVDKEGLMRKVRALYERINCNDYYLSGIVLGRMQGDESNRLRCSL